MKGFYTFLLGISMLLSMQLLSAQNANITIGNASATTVGQQVCLPISGQNFTDILGFQFSINYAPAVLEFAGSTGQVIFGQTVFIQSNSPGLISLTWNVFSADVLTNAGPFPIGEICFNVLQVVETTVSISNTPIPIELFSLSGNVPNVGTTNGIVNEGVGGTMPTCDDGIQNGNETGVDCGGSCAPCPTCNDGIQNGNETGVDCGGSCAPCMTGSDDLTFSLSSASGAVGTQVCMDVSTQNFTAIGAFQFSMSYNPAVLQYVSATNLAFADINVVQPMASPGQIRVSWVYFQPDNVGGNLANGSRVFTLCFNVLQATGTTVAFTGTPIGIEGFDVNNVALPVVTNNGNVNGGGTTPTCSDGIQNGNETGVDCGGSCAPCMTMGGNCGENSNDLTLCLSNECANVGQQACVDVVVANFNAVTGMQFRVNYDAATLTYVSRTANPAFAGGVNVNQNNPGQLTALWFDGSQTFQGVSLNDNTVALTLCFNVNGPLTAPITLSLVSFTDPDGNTINPVIVNPGSVNGAGCGGGSTPTCNDGIQNGNETGVDCGGSCAPCMTMGGDCGENSSNLNFCVASGCAAVGQQVCLDIDVANFSSIVGFQFNINYPGPNLQYTNITFNPAISLGAQVSPNSDGQITILWVDPSQAFLGVSIPNGETAMTVCFTTELPSTATVSLTNASASNANDVTLSPIQLNSGTVNAPACSGGTPTCNDGIQNGNETGVDCGGSCAPCPTCDDGIQNGNETGVDCGGSCAPCMTMASCGENSSDLNLCVSEACNNTVGTQVCVDVDVSAFTSIVGFEFRLNYTGANLEYVSRTSNPALVGGATVNATSDGEIRVLWFDPSPAFQGATIPNGETLISFCFTVENTAATPITITNTSFSNTAGVITPVIVNNGSVNGSGCSVVTPTCNDGIQNGNETGVDCGGSCAPCPTCNDGIQNGNETGIDCGGSCPPCMTMASCGENSSDLNLCVSEACNNTVGTQVCVDVDVSAFTSVVGFEFRLNYAGANLEYVSRTSNPALIGGATVNASSDGEIRVLWFDPSPAFQGATIPNGETLISFCFTVENAAATPITITNTSFSNTAGVITPVIVNNGSVNGSGCSVVTPTCNDGIQNGDETGIDCGGSCPPCMTMGQGDVTFNIGSGTADVGEQVCVDIQVRDFDDIRSLALNLTYNPDILQISSIQATNNLLGFNSGSFNLLSAGNLAINWTGTNGQALADDSVLFTVCFTAIGAGTSNASFQPTATAAAGNGSNVTVVTNPGSITTVNNFQDLTFIMGNGMADLGENICLEVPVYNFTNITSFSFTINYDPSKVSFDQLVPNTTVPPGGSFQATNLVPGEIRVLWLYNPQDFAGITLADGTALFSVCFDVVEACQTAVELTDNPTSIAATDDNGNSLPVNVIPGLINGGVPCGSCNPQNLILDIGDGTGSVGAEVCLDITTENFFGLTDLAFTLGYDPGVLNFARVENFGLGSISLANFTIGPAGQIIFNWESPNMDGQSIVNGDVLFSLCFDVAVLEQTPIVFAGSPTPVQAMNGCGVNVGIVTRNGTINQGIPTGEGLILQILCEEAAVGDAICVPIRAFGLVDLLGLQFSLDYDPALLSFTGLAPNPAIPMLVNNSAPGDIRVTWSDLSGNTITIPDGGIIGEFCFEVLSTTPATIAFSNLPIPSEFIDENGTVDATLLNCAINGSGAPVVANATITPPSCSDANDGRIELTVTGPPSLVYNWIPNPSGSSGPVLNGAPAGTYIVQIINATTGESTSASYTIVAPPAFSPFVEVENVSCFGQNDGIIRVVPAGGVGPYQYDWSGSLQDGVAEQTGLGSGLYSVTVTDANGCSRVFANRQITAPAAAITLPGIINNISEQPGAITVQALNAAMPVAFNWSGPNGFSSMEGSLTGLTVPGTYCLTVSDANGCTAAQCYQVREDLRISNFELGESCSGTNTGFINITVVGGTGMYVFDWRGPNGYLATAEDIQGLASGVYMLTITSGTESVSANYTVEELDPIALNASVFPANLGNNGRISLTPSGGEMPYRFEWSNGATTAEIDMLSGGEYCVTVTDNNDCTRENCYTVTSIPMSVASVSTNSTSCFEGEDGSATIILANGVAPYVVSVSPSGFTANISSDTIIIPLPAGTYTVSITDDQGSGVEQEVTITSPTAVVVGETVVVSDTEDAECTGSISLLISGGTGPYTVSWNLPSLSGAQVSGLCAGVYEATVTDANGCVIEPVIIEIGQLAESATTTEVECPGDASGTIDLDVSGGVAPYTFEWRIAGSMEVISTEEDLNELTAGEYTVTITDATGARLVRTYSVSTALGFSLSTSIASNFNGFGVSCQGESDGRLVVQVSGLGTYTYEWFRGEMLVGIDSVLANVGAGSYSVRVTSDTGCEQSSAVLNITEPAALSLQSEVQNVSCIEERDGRITVSPQGGIAPYTYNWSNGTTLSQAQFLRPGEYSVLVSDRNGCTAMADFTISSPPELVLTSEETDADNGCNGTITILPLGGASNYNYSWPQLPGQGNNPVARDLCPGEYTVIVTDENNCQSVSRTISVRDRRFPCLIERNVITPNGDGLNEAFILFCTDGDEVSNNRLEIYNRWGQLVFQVSGYNCSEDGGRNCFTGLTNSGEVLPEGPYYYVLDYSNPLGEQRQQRGSLTILRE